MNNFLGKWDWVVALCLMSDKKSPKFSNYFYVERKIFCTQGVCKHKKLSNMTGANFHEKGHSKIDMETIIQKLFEEDQQ